MASLNGSAYNKNNVKVHPRRKMHGRTIPYNPANRPHPRTSQDDNSRPPGAPQFPAPSVHEESWRTECTKIIKTMLELSDAEPFLRPVSSSQYPTFYTKHKKTSCLEKITRFLVYRRYTGLQSFADDVNKMFEDYQSFFKNISSDIYLKACRLSWWFGLEVKKIKANGGQHWNQKHNQQRDASHNPSCSNAAGGSSSKQFTSNGYQSTSQSHQSKDTHREDSRRVTLDISSKNGVYSRDTRNEPMLSIVSNERDGRRVTTCSTESSSETAPSRRSSATENCHKDVGSSHARKNPQRPADTAGSQSTSRQTSKTPAVTTTNTAQSKPQTPSQETQAHQQRLPGANATTSAVTSRPGKTMELKLYAYNIWTWQARLKPRTKLCLSTKGLQTQVDTADKKALNFMIKSQEIIRCMVHTRRTDKHTLFVFVLPSCMKRLESQLNRTIGCCNIVTFFVTMNEAQYSQMVYLFWCISKASMFKDIFSEIDQKEAVSLMSEIKPSFANKFPQWMNSPKSPSASSPNTSYNNDELIMSPRQASTSGHELMDLSDSPLSPVSATSASEMTLCTTSTSNTTASLADTMDCSSKTKTLSGEKTPCSSASISSNTAPSSVATQSSCTVSTATTSTTSAATAHCEPSPQQSANQQSSTLLLAQSQVDMLSRIEQLLQLAMASPIGLSQTLQGGATPILSPSVDLPFRATQRNEHESKHQSITSVPNNESVRLNSTKSQIASPDCSENEIKNTNPTENQIASPDCSENEITNTNPTENQIASPDCSENEITNTNPTENQIASPDCSENDITNTNPTEIQIASPDYSEDEITNPNSVDCEIINQSDAVTTSATDSTFVNTSAINILSEANNMEVGLDSSENQSLTSPDLASGHSPDMVVSPDCNQNQEVSEEPQNMDVSSESTGSEKLIIEQARDEVVSRCRNESGSSGKDGETAEQSISIDLTSTSTVNTTPSVARTSSHSTVLPVNMTSTWHSPSTSVQPVHATPSIQRIHPPPTANTTVSIDCMNVSPVAITATVQRTTAPPVSTTASIHRISHSTTSPPVSTTASIHRIRHSPTAPPVSTTASIHRISHSTSTPPGNTPANLHTTSPSTAVLSSNTSTSLHIASHYTAVPPVNTTVSLHGYSPSTTLPQVSGRNPLSDSFTYLSNLIQNSQVTNSAVEMTPQRLAPAQHRLPAQLRPAQTCLSVASTQNCNRSRCSSGPPHLESLQANSMDKHGRLRSTAGLDDRSANSAPTALSNLTDFVEGSTLFRMAQNCLREQSGASFNHPNIISSYASNPSPVMPTLSNSMGYLQHQDPRFFANPMVMSSCPSADRSPVMAAVNSQNYSEQMTARMYSSPNISCSSNRSPITSSTTASSSNSSTWRPSWRPATPCQDEEAHNSDDDSLVILDDEEEISIVTPCGIDDVITVRNSQSDMVQGDDIVMTETTISIRCPITMQIMNQPMKNIHCGHCYDSAGVEELIRQRGGKARCPVAGCSNKIPLLFRDMVYQHDLKKHIASKRTS